MPIPTAFVSTATPLTSGTCRPSSIATSSFRPPRLHRVRTAPRRTIQQRRRPRHFVPQACEPQEAQPLEEDDTASPAAAFRPFRKLLLALSMAGAAETTYLTFNKFFSDPGAICATQGCLDVLSGPFSTFLGIPLTLYGALSYTVFVYLCVWPLCAPTEAEILAAEGAQSGEASTQKATSYETRDAATRPIMLALSTAQFIFSAYLVCILLFVIKSMCPYCVFSATISTLIFLFTAFVGRAVSTPKMALTIGATSTLISSAAAAVLFSVSWPTHILAQPPSEAQAPPAITQSSTRDSMRIAGKLKEKHTKMYGAYWCKHCYDQKQRFGKKAFEKIKYIECDKYGVNSEFQLCRDKRIPGYPTWEIDGKLFPGEIEPNELERIVDENVENN